MISGFGYHCFCSMYQFDRLMVSDFAVTSKRREMSIRQISTRLLFELLARIELALRLGQVPVAFHLKYVVDDFIKFT